MVIDGQSLAEALNDHRSLLSDVAEHCEAVVCCRMSPLQKAEVFVFLSVITEMRMVLLQSNYLIGSEASERISEQAYYCRCWRWSKRCFDDSRSAHRPWYIFFSQQLNAVVLIFLFIFKVSWERKVARQFAVLISLLLASDSCVEPCWCTVIGITGGYQTRSNTFSTRILFSILLSFSLPSSALILLKSVS